jgi:hypothetical protein
MRTALLLLATALFAPGCLRRNCVPPDLADRKYVDAACGAEAHAPVVSRLREVEAEFRRQTAAAAPPGRPYHFLALSGGGMYGAFGVGVIHGWTQSGARPQFDVVTGISTGGLMATFVFLGPQYDAALYEAMVGVDRRDLLGLSFFPSSPIGDAFFHNRPIKRRINRYITPEVVAEVAAAHAAGRRLYIATTNLDARKLVIWDMGAIASRGTPEAVELYRTVMLASASVPGAFPPVTIPVEVDGRCYEELHVDGGASDEVIFRSFMVADLNRAAGVPGSVATPGSVLFVVNNGKLYAEPACVRPHVLPIINATARSILYGKGRDELYRIYINCLETGVAFRTTAVPQDLRIEARGALAIADESQQDLFRAGVEAGRSPGAGEHWRDLPAGANPSEQALPRSGTRFVTVPR